MVHNGGKRRKNSTGGEPGRKRKESGGTWADQTLLGREEQMEQQHSYTAVWMTFSVWQAGQQTHTVFILFFCLVIWGSEGTNWCTGAGILQRFKVRWSRRQKIVAVRRRKRSWTHLHANFKCLQQLCSYSSECPPDWWVFRALWSTWHQPTFILNIKHLSTDTKT